jgi:hypothetical protein
MEGDQQFILGLWLGVFTETHLKRTRKKRDYELGRACIHALQVKHYFSNEPRLGMAALKRDNFFFGNDPSEKDANGNTVPYYLKERLSSIFKSATHAKAFMAVLNYISFTIQLDLLEGEELTKTVGYHLRDVDDILPDFYRPEYAQRKGKQVLIGMRKPNPLRTSPVFLQEEMQILASLTAYKFQNLGPLKKDWQGLVNTYGYAEMYSDIRSIIQSRWQTLEKFAKVTTKRLQRTRTANPNVRLNRKVDVTRDNVIALLATRDHPETAFLREIEIIIPDTEFVDSVRVWKKRCPANLQEAKDIVHYNLSIMYHDVQDLDYVLYEDAEEATLSGIVTTETEAIIRQIGSASTIVNTVDVNIKGIRANMLTHKVPGRARAIEEIIRKRCNDIIAVFQYDYRQIQIATHEMGLTQVGIPGLRSQIGGLPEKIDSAIKIIDAEIIQKNLQKDDINHQSLQTAKNRLVSALKTLNESVEAGRGLGNQSSKAFEPLIDTSNDG